MSIDYNILNTAQFCMYTGAYMYMSVKSRKKKNKNKAMKYFAEVGKK